MVTTHRTKPLCPEVAQKPAQGSITANSSGGTRHKILAPNTKDRLLEIDDITTEDGGQTFCYYVE